MSLVLSKVSVKGIGGIAEGQYSFEKGVTIIAGPNESGKTSLFRAIEWGLTGQSEVELSELLNNMFNEALVELTLEGEEKSYRIWRTLMRHDKRIETDATLTLLPEGEEVKGSAYVDASLESLFGISMKTIHGTMFSGRRDELIAYLTEGRSLRDFIGEISGATDYDRALRGISRVVGKLKDRYEEALRRATERAGAKALLEQTRHDLNEKRSDLESKHESLKSVRVKYEEIEKKLHLLQERSEKIKEKKREIESVERELMRNEQRKREFISEIEEGKKNVRTLTSDLENLENRNKELSSQLGRLDTELKEVIRSVNVFEADLRKLEEQLRVVTTLKEILTELNELEKHKASLSVKLSEVQEKLSGKESELEKSKRMLDDFKVKVSTIDSIFTLVEKSEKECPICKKPWDRKDHQECLERLLAERSVSAQEFDNLKPFVTELEKVVMKLKEEIKILNGELIRIEMRHKTRIEDLHKYRGVLSVAISSIEEAEAQIEEFDNKIRYARDNIAKLDDKRREISRDIEKFGSELTKVDKEISHITGRKSMIERTIIRSKEGLSRVMDEEKLLKERLGMLQGDLKILELTYNMEEHDILRKQSIKLRDEKMSLETQIKQLESEIEILKGRIVKYEKEAEEYKKLEREANICRKASIIQSIIEKVVERVSTYLKEGVIDAINSETPKILAELGFKLDEFRLTKDYKIHIARDKRKLTINMMGDGLRGTIGMAMKLAIAERTYGTPFIMCYDGCLILDEEREQKLMELLKRKGISPIITVTEATPTGKLMIRKL